MLPKPEASSEMLPSVYFPKSDSYEDLRYLVNASLTWAEPQGLSPLSHKPGMLMHDYNHSIEEREAGGPGVQGHPQLHSKFDVSLEFKKSCLKKFLTLLYCNLLIFKC